MRMLVRACVLALALLALVPAMASASTISGKALRRGNETGTTPWWAKCDGVTANVALRINGGSPQSTTCSGVDGSFTFSGVTLTGTSTIVIYLDDASDRGALWYRTTETSDIAGLYVSLQHARLKQYAACGATCNFTNATIDAYDGSTNSKLPLDATATTLDTPSTGTQTVLFVEASTTYTAAATTTLDKLRSDGVFNAGGNLVILRGTTNYGSAYGCSGSAADNNNPETQTTICIATVASFATSAGGNLRFTMDRGPTKIAEMQFSGSATYYSLWRVEVRPQANSSNLSTQSMRIAELDAGNAGYSMVLHNGWIISATRAGGSGNIVIGDGVQVRSTNAAGNLSYRVEATGSITGDGEFIRNTSGGLNIIHMCPTTGSTVTLGTTGGSKIWKTADVRVFAPASGSATVRLASGGSGAIDVQGLLDVASSNTGPGDSVCTAGGGAVTLDANTNDRQITFTNDTTFTDYGARVNEGGTFLASDTYDLNLGAGQATVLADGASGRNAVWTGAGRALATTGAMTVTAGSTNDDATFTSGAGSVTVGGSLLVQGTAAGADALAAMGASAVDVDGDVTISSTNGTSTAAYQVVGAGSLAIQGSFRRAGGTSASFAAGSGSVTFDGAGISFLSQDANSTTFNDLRNVTAGKVVRVSTAGTWSVANELRLQGTSCDARAGIASTQDGVQYAMSVASASVQYADIGDFNQTSATKTAASSIGVDPWSNNAGWSFTSPCATYAITGNALDADGGGGWSQCNGATQNLALDVNGFKPIPTSCAAGTGAFSIQARTQPGDLLLVFMNPSSAGDKGATYSLGPAVAGPVSGLVIARGQVRVSTAPSGTMTPTIMSRYDSSISTWHAGEPDIPVDVTTTAVTATSAELMIESSSRLLVSTRRVDVAAIDLAGQLDVGANAVSVASSGTNSSCTAAIGTSVPMCIRSGGAFASTAASTFDYLGTAATDVWPTTYGVLRVLPAASPTYRLGVSGSSDPIVAQGGLAIGTGTSGQAVIVDTSAYAPNVTVTGAATVARYATLSGSGAGTILVNGTLTGLGAIDLTGGTVQVTTPESVASPTFGGTGGVAWTWRFNDLVVDLAASTSSNRTVVVGALGTMGVRGNLAIGASSSTMAMTLDLDTNDPTFDVDGDLTIRARGRLTASSMATPGALSIGRDFVNDSDTASGFTASGGRVDLDGATTGTVRGTRNTTFATLAIQPVAAKQVRFDTSRNTTVSGTLLASGGSCQITVDLQSTSAGVATALNVTGTAVLEYATIRDLTTSVAQTAYRTGDLGNTSGWTYSGGCPYLGATDMYVDDANASAGSTHPTTIVSATPHLSFRNRIGQAANAQQVEVLSTPLDDVVALWHMDSTPGVVQDSTANDLDLTLSGSPATVSGATNFQQAMDLNGTSQYATSAVSGLLQLPSSFTVEAWIKPDSIGGTRTIVERGDAGGSNRNFALRIVGGNLQARVTRAAPTTDVTVSATATGLDDGAWHHVAMTMDAGYQLRLFRDGTEVGTTTNVGGAAWSSAAAASIGRSSAGSDYFDGAIDDVRVSSVAHGATEILGAVKTTQPHATSVWTSGQLATTCSDSARCGDVIYGGSSLQLNDARWYARVRMRQTVGNSWSAWSGADWFGTTVWTYSITIPDGAPAFGSVLPGTTVTTSSRLEVATTDPDGYQLLANDPDDDGDFVGTSTIPRWSSEPTSPGAWPIGTPVGFGMTVLSATGGKNPAWGAGTTLQDVSLLNWIGLRQATMGTLHERTSDTGGTPDTVVVGFRLGTSGTAPPGSYASTVTYTILPRP